MKKFFAVLMLAAALLLPGLAQAKDAQTSMIDDVVKRGVLRVGFSSFVPWAMQDKNGEFVGFEIDVAKRLAKDLGVELQLVPTKWAGIIPALMAGKFDVIIGSMSVTPERNLKANFTVPYDYATIEVMANKEKTKGMTVFIVSQRAASVQRADHILVLDDGCLVGDAPHAELLKTCEVYKEICLSQLSREEVAQTL